MNSGLLFMQPSGLLVSIPYAWGVTENSMLSLGD